MDLRASGNLLSYSVYRRLGLGELRHIKAKLQLTDRSMKKSIREIEEVLSKIGKFIFPIDFIVLETQLAVNS